MRIAVISDIHANLPALEAVLADVDGESPDELWCLGDVVGYGPHPNECVDLCKTNDDTYACVSQAPDCAAVARCFLANVCGRTMIPRGTGSCRSVLTCNERCADNSTECMCGCVAKAAPKHSLLLGKRVMCAFKCQLDQNCIDQKCTRYSAECSQQ